MQLPELLSTLFQSFPIRRRVVSKGRRERSGNGEISRKLLAERFSREMQTGAVILKPLISRFGFRFRILENFQDGSCTVTTIVGCFEQEEVRLEVGLDAVALGRNIDHGVGERQKGRMTRDEGQGEQVVCLHSLSLCLFPRSRQRCRGAKGMTRGQRDQLKRYNGAHSLHTHVCGYTGWSSKGNFCSSASHFPWLSNLFRYSS